MQKGIFIFNYNFQNNADSEWLDIYIDGDIVDASTQEILQDWWGDETSVSFKSIRNQVLDSGKKKIRFTVNSYGGHVGDAMAIHDWIVNLENEGYQVETIGCGMVCSAATYIVSASKNSKITENSWYMIHNVSGAVYGDVNVIENYARTMRKFNDTISNFYANKTGKTFEEIQEWMNQETWFTGKETHENKFVNELIETTNFTNFIEKEKFPYRNQSALNLYNSAVKKPTEPKNNNNQIFNMKNLKNALMDVFKDLGFVANKENPDEDKNFKPVTQEALENALDNAIGKVDIKEEVQNSIDEIFKDGLPENLLNSVKESIQNTVTEKFAEASKAPLENFTKEVTTATEKLTNLQQEIETTQQSFIENVGGAKPRNKPKNEDDKDKVINGVGWGDQDDDEE
ncbi:Clp protease ClpP [Empedobacter falsenii]|uniref:Clp protease ClpP n=1 Tax=Empedobacter falsenii TaxID=343874 RepID=UPI003A7FCE64